MELRSILNQRIDFIVVFELIDGVLKVGYSFFRHTGCKSSPVLMSDHFIDSWSSVLHAIVITIFE